MTSLDNKVEKFDIDNTLSQIELSKGLYNVKLAENQKLVFNSLLTNSLLNIMGTVGAYSSDFKSIGYGLSCIALTSVGIGFYELISKNPKISNHITKKQLEYEPNELERKILNIVSEQ